MILIRVAAPQIYFTTPRPIGLDHAFLHQRELLPRNQECDCGIVGASGNFQTHRHLFRLEQQTLVRLHTVTAVRDASHMGLALLAKVTLRATRVRVRNHKLLNSPVRGTSRNCFFSVDRPQLVVVLVY